LVGKLKSRRTLTGLVTTSTHATTTAMHFPPNAALIFLTDELTHDRYLIDTGARLSLFPVLQKPLHLAPGSKGQMDNQSPLGDLFKELSNSMAKFFLRSFCKQLWQV
jgi:hypothetical protein